MFSYDKILTNVLPEIIATINTLNSQGNTAQIQQWHSECIAEIKFRENLKVNTYPLYYEKEYLEKFLA